ncbi:hypothetical protein PISMIDRAFT_16565 [Pisolithus microcarpus 441]|uniref:Uncharacterized protein n=1 Tax=Pisolithus microcarpus 441 TaxID=765257 RepID=A0A0C9YN78_9AGAM|nr:hypothetical protein PISMIDRAFT_16565 [Pisolithus microcarpus 441]
MSPIPLSFSGFSDNQSPPMFSSKSLQDPFHTPSNNYLGPYQVQAINSSVFGQGIPEILHVQQLQSLQDTITKLQLENSSLKAEHDAIQGAYNMLISQLTVMRSDSMTPADGPINIMLQSAPIVPTPLLKGDFLPHLNQVNYPDVRFWTEKDWKTWSSMTLEGQRANPYTSYFEDNKGEPLNAEKIGNILQTVQEIWHEFCTHGVIKTDTTWSSMSLPVKKAFRSEISRAHSDLNLCEDGWKIDMIGKRYYSSFKQMWFTNRSDDSGKQKAKKESTDDTTLSPKPKRVKLTLSLSPEDSGHSTGDSTSNRSASNTGDSSTLSSSSILGPCTPSGPSSRQYTFPDADNVSQFDDNYTRAHAPGKKACKG